MCVCKLLGYMLSCVCVTLAECWGRDDILHSRVLPGITATVSRTSGMLSASSLSTPSGSSCVQVNTDHTDARRHTSDINSPFNKIK